MAIDIREYDGRYDSAILRLHETVFGEVDLDRYDETQRQKVRDILENGRSVIAVDGKKLVGLGLSASMENMPGHHGRTQKDGTGTWLSWAKKPKKKAELEGILKDLWEREVTVTTYDNRFIRSATEPTDNDWYMDGVAVHPDYRGQGIGTKLTEERLQFAMEEQAAAAYASLHLKGQGIGKIYANLGFFPFLKITPGYPDGSAVKYVGKKL